MFVQEGGGDRLIPGANSIDIQFRLVLGDRRLRRDVAFITAAPPDSVITEHRGSMTRTAMIFRDDPAIRGGRIHGGKVEDSSRNA